MGNSAPRQSSIDKVDPGSSICASIGTGCIFEASMMLAISLPLSRIESSCVGGMVGTVVDVVVVFLARLSPVLLVASQIPVPARAMTVAVAAPRMSQGVRLERVDGGVHGGGWVQGSGPLAGGALCWLCSSRVAARYWSVA